MRLSLHAFRIFCLSACLMAHVFGQTRFRPPDYDSRTSPAPHNFNWNDHFEYVRIRDHSTCKFHGGFARGLVLTNKASGTVNQGVFNYIETDDLAELTILNARTAYVYAHGRSRIDLYDSKNITAEAQANASAQLMIHGGRFDRVYTWPLGGTIELDGYLVTGSLTANDGGILRQNGGRSQSLSSADGGLAILDQGTVQEYMGSSGRSTLVIAGGIPPEEDIRLFSQARVLVFHSGAAIQGKTITEKHSKLILADLDEKGISSDYSSISTVLTLDGHDRKAFFSAWNHDWPNKWTGSLELIQLNDELYVEILPGTRMALLAFRVPRTVVIQPQVSKDGGSWEPLGDPIFGDGAIHTAESRLHGDEKQTFRLHISNNS